MHLGQEFGTERIVLLPFVNKLHFKAEKFLLSVSTLTGYQTESKLPDSGLCAHIILKTCVLQGKGTEMLGSLY